MLGDNLVAKGLISPAQLQEALEAQKAAPGERLGDLLVKRGWVSPQQVEANLKP
jgi:hypothetical protein